MDAVKENINRFVEDHSTTKDALAKAMGISRSSLYDKMNGRRPWMLVEIIDLAAFMGCTVQDLLTMPECTAQGVA